jgi:hypothetical protein
VERAALVRAAAQAEAARPGAAPVVVEQTEVAPLSAGSMVECLPAEAVETAGRLTEARPVAADRTTEARPVADRRSEVLPTAVLALAAPARPVPRSLPRP